MGLCWFCLALTYSCIIKLWFVIVQISTIQLFNLFSADIENMYNDFYADLCIPFILQILSSVLLKRGNFHHLLFFCFSFVHFNKLLIVMFFFLSCQTVNCHVHVIDVYLLCWSLPLLFVSRLFVSLLDNCCFSCTPTFTHLSVCLLHNTFLFPLASFIQCRLRSPCLLHQPHWRPSSWVFKSSLVSFSDNHSYLFQDVAHIQDQQ